MLGVSNEALLAPLAELLDAPNAELRVQIALILGERGDKRGSPALLRALKDEDSNVRFHAIEALGKIGARDAADALIEVVESEDFFLAFPALEALAAINEPRVAVRIVPLLAKELLQEAAVAALGALGNEEVVGPLAQLINQVNAPTAAIARALAAVYTRYELLYREGADIAALARCFINAVGALIALVLDSDHREACINALIAVGDRQIGEVTTGLLHPQAEGRRAVVEALSRCKHPRSAESLQSALNDSDTSVRLAAIHALRHTGHSGAC